MLHRESLKKIELTIGKQLKRRRVEVGLNQEELGKIVGVSFQQIQKYEKGSNKVSAIRLFQFSKILNVELDFFFQEDDVSATVDSAIYLSESENNNFEDEVDPKEVKVLVKSFLQIADKGVRKKMLSLIKELKNE